MNQQSRSITCNQALKCLLGTLFLIIWLLSSSYSLVHAQEHALLEEDNCHICFITENSSSEITAHQPLLIPLEPINSNIDAKTITIFYINHPFLNSRDPPVILFI